MTIAELTAVPAALRRLAPLVALLLVIAPGNVLAEQRCYADRGEEVCFPLGLLSFADAVISLRIGDPEPKTGVSLDPLAALGEPDNDPSTENEKNATQPYVTLGCGGTLIVQFRDNILIDVAGPDLYVFEIGGAVEATRLSISENGVNWIEIGVIQGGLATVDIEAFAGPGAQYRYVRLVDEGSRCSGDWAGADIDAVGAIGSALRPPDPYADDVVDWQVGNPRWSEGTSEPHYALGAPDYPGNHFDPTIATLGCGGQTIVRFSDNDLVDGEGADLRIYEPGDREAFQVEISVDGRSWRNLGESSGGDTSFDIASVAGQNERFYFVRITDLKKNCSGSRPGADIDAVEALNTSDRFGPGNLRPDLASVEIIAPDSQDPIDEIAIGESFRVRLTYAKAPDSEITETVTIGTLDGGSQQVQVTGNSRVIVSGLVTVAAKRQ